ncbi:seipin-like [Denticeps clupeoides]|uniref:seipin-like n=1 Tax=Denticeps clupeoides TaxID=299321 RepID=UPI0010A514E7|nr:seipin-like [Denticeps clupeoides]
MASYKMESEVEDADPRPPTAEELVGQVGALVQRVQDAGRQLLLRLWQGALQLALLMLLLTLLLWVAAFLYGSFYYSYMPTPSYSAPVHFFYSAECDSAICSFPRANISLLQDGQKQVMTYGQPYRISLHLDMPESPANQNLGMFMVKMSCYSHGGKVISTSARSSVGTLLFSPLLLTGVTEQKQVVTIELFSAYRENAYLPTVGVVVELQSQRVQIYSAVLLVHAHFTGIRYVLYQFPGLSALLGVASNFGFLSLLILLSSAQFSWRRFVSAPVRDLSRLVTHQHDRSEDVAMVTDLRANNGHTGDENVPDAQSTDEQGTGSAGQGSEVETTSSVSEETPCDVNVEETDAAVFCSSPPRPEEVNCIIS